MNSPVSASATIRPTTSCVMRWSNALTQMGNASMVGLAMKLVGVIVFVLQIHQSQVGSVRSLLIVVFMVVPMEGSVP